jgi:hypothetical protein
MKTKLTLFIITLPFIIVIILGSFAISVMSIIENKRFIEGTNLILSIPKAVATFQKNRPAISFAPNDNILEILAHANLFPKQSIHINPWGGMIKAAAIDSQTFRIYTSIPPSVCRKLSLYFEKYDFSDTGLAAMYVSQDNTESLVATFSAAKKESSSKIESACDDGVMAYVAIEFGI